MNIVRRSPTKLFVNSLRNSSTIIKNEYIISTTGEKLLITYLISIVGCTVCYPVWESYNNVQKYLLTYDGIHNYDYNHKYDAATKNAFNNTIAGFVLGIIWPFMLPICVIPVVIGKTVCLLTPDNKK